MKNAQIHTKVARAKLPARNNPYYKNIGDGAIGYHKTASGGEKWKARCRGEDGQYHFRTIGNVANVDYRQAVKLSGEWFGQCNVGVPKACTVEEACQDYIANQWAITDSSATANSEAYFKNLVYKVPFGRKPLDKLKPRDIERWRDSLVTDKRGKGTANRILRNLKAALNYAYHQGTAPSDRAWKVVRFFPKAEGRRERILDEADKAELMGNAAPEVLPLVRGLLLTGARPSELAACSVSDFDQINRTLKLVKTKDKNTNTARYFPLVGAALAFFKSQVKNKLPTAPLISNPNGGYWHRHQWPKYLRPHGMDAYTCRHTAISEFLAIGIDAGTVAQITGTSIRMIERNYQKVIRPMLEEKLAAIK